MIGISNITFFISNRCLFSNINFQINDGDRIGLVGPNGVGKTTLLKILIGKYKAEDGNVEVPRGTTVGYLEQEVHEQRSDLSIRDLAMRAFDEAITLESRIVELSSSLEKITDFYSDEYHNILDELEHSRVRYELLEGDRKEAKTEEVLEGLGFKTEQLDLPLSQFSGGWRMRVALAKMLLERPDVLLLDEPTNHLDIDSIEWLEQYLNSYKGAVVIVSHDQYFLNRLVNRIFEIRNKKIYQYTGNYDKYLTQRDEQIEQQAREYEAQQREINEAEKFISRFRYKATKARQVQSRVKQMEKMELIEAPEPLQEQIHFHFPEPPRSGKTVLEIRKLLKTYKTEDGKGEVRVFTEGQNLEVDRGDKVAIVGVNGAGKSTLARIIDGIEPFDGERIVGHNVIMAFFAQNLADVMDSSRTVLEEMEQSAKSADARTQVRNILGSFLFTGDDVFKSIKVLSGGERSRLALAKTLLEPANLIILDEPTNHLDITSKNILLKALNEFKGTVISISHDRHFLSGFANKVWRVQDGRVTVYPGDYEYYQWKHKQESEEALIGEREKIVEPNGKELENNTVSGPKTKEQKRIEAELRNQLHKQTRDLKKKINQLESSIEKLEKEKMELEEKLADPEFYQNGDAAKATNRYQAVQSDLEKAMGKWSEQTEKLEQIEEEVKLKLESM